VNDTATTGIEEFAHFLYNLVGCGDVARSSVEEFFFDLRISLNGAAVKIINRIFEPAESQFELTAHQLRAVAIVATKKSCKLHNLLE